MNIFRALVGTRAQVHREPEAAQVLADQLDLAPEIDGLQDLDAPPALPAADTPAAAESKPAAVTTRTRRGGNAS